MLAFSGGEATQLKSFLNQKSIGASVSDKSQLVKEKHGHAAVS